MSQLTTNNSYSIVNALSDINLPRDLLESANISELIQNIHRAQIDTRNASEKLAHARQAQKDGNFIGNLWHNRSDVIKDANLDLSASLGNLTEQSSKLIVFNTAISKILMEQQNTLQLQQTQLHKQTAQLEEQQRTIENQQKEIYQAHQKLIFQQEEINRANNGLMEAKGITKEQAERLVGVTKLAERLSEEIKNDNMETLEKISSILKHIYQDIQQSNDILKQQVIHEKNNILDIAATCKNDFIETKNNIIKDNTDKLHSFQINSESKLKRKWEEEKDSFIELHTQHLNEVNDIRLNTEKWLDNEDRKLKSFQIDIENNYQNIKQNFSEFKMHITETTTNYTNFSQEKINSFIEAQTKHSKKYMIYLYIISILSIIAVGLSVYKDLLPILKNL